MMECRPVPLSFDVGSAARPFFGEEVCGDRGRVLLEPGGGFLIALADGLGHGPAAAEASCQFCDLVEHRRTEPLEDILRCAATELARTRGAAGALLRLHPSGELQFAGVGNIGLAAHTAVPFSAFSTAGILGRRLRSVRTWGGVLSVGDGLVLYTDGISLRSDVSDVPWGAPAVVIAETLVRVGGKRTDDASCVVIRCLRSARPI